MRRDRPDNLSHCWPNRRPPSADAVRHGIDPARPGDDPRQRAIPAGCRRRDQGIGPMKVFFLSLITAWFTPRAALRRLAGHRANWTPALLGALDGIRFFIDQVEQRGAVDDFGGFAGAVTM